LIYRIIESDNDNEEVNRSFGVFNDFIIKGRFCFFRPFAEVMFKDMVDNVSDKQRKGKEDHGCDAFTEKRVEVYAIVSEELVYDVT
jgi:hypothetical protein